MTPICANAPHHQKTILRAQRAMPNDDALVRLGEFFALLKDPTRLKIIYALSEGELCVCDIAELLAMNVPAVSQQLKALRLAEIITARKDGLQVYYSLTDPHAVESINLAIAHLVEADGHAHAYAPIAPKQLKGKTKTLRSGNECAHETANPARANAANNSRAIKK